MGMRLFIPADAAGPPYPVLITVECDGDHADLFGRPSATFETEGVHPRHPATQAGWKFDQDGPVLCPACR